MSESKIFNRFIVAFRAIIGLILIAFQGILLYYILFNVNSLATYSYFTFYAIALVVALYILGTSKNYSYKLSWVFFLLVFPATALVFYLLYGRLRYVKKHIKKENEVSKKIGITTSRDQSLINSIEDKHVRSQLDLLYEKGKLDSYTSTDAKYFEVGELFFDDMLIKIKDAKEYILLEHFIVSDGVLFEQMSELLIERARNGVEIYFMYDSAGSITTAPHDRLLDLTENGVKVHAYNSKVSNLYTFISYRSHRKIAVIDGEYIYTGGNNIADEYVNKVERFGHWKDMGVRLKGNITKQFIDVFFTAWCTETKEAIDVNKYYRNIVTNSSSIVTPIIDGPTNQENPAKYNYMKIISTATEYVYITTPYLIIDDEMTSALLLAARSGVDVRILIPGVPDKKFVYQVSLAHINTLLDAGIKIYKYTPGFVHGKVVVSDNEISVVGSINFDFRSLDWNYECGVHVYDEKFAKTVFNDFINTIGKSEQISKSSWDKAFHPSRMFSGILRLISPLL